MEERYKQYREFLSKVEKKFSKEDYAYFLNECKNYFINASKLSQMQRDLTSSERNIENILKNNSIENQESGHEIAEGICSVIFEERSR